MKCKKRVLIIIPHLGVGGTEVQTLSLIKALINLGYKITVLCLFRHVKEMVKKYEEEGVELIYLSPQYDRFGIKIDYPYGWDLIKFLINGLRRALKLSKPDIVHVQYMTPASTIILLLKYYFRFNNIIATSHTAGDHYSKKNLKLVRYIAGNCLKGFQCITERAERSFFGSVGKLATGNGQLVKGSHFTIYNCLPEYVEIRAVGSRQWAEGKPITIGVVSRLEPIKGMDLVVPAFAKVHEEFPNTRLLVAGDGSLREWMEAQVVGRGQRAEGRGLEAEGNRDTSSVEESVTFVGRKGQDELQAYYDQIDVLLMPSRSEGFGLTAVEGMARGCVPVVADTGGLPEVVQDGVNGLLHRPEDVEDMAEKIKSLIADHFDRIAYGGKQQGCVKAQGAEKYTTNGQSLLEKFSTAAIERARDFSVENYNASIANWYNTLL